MNADEHQNRSGFLIGVHLWLIIYLSLSAHPTSFGGRVALFHSLYTFPVGRHTINSTSMVEMTATATSPTGT